MATRYHGEIRDHLDKNFPYLIVVFDSAGRVAAKIPAKILAEAAIDLHERIAGLERVTSFPRRTPSERPNQINGKQSPSRIFKHER
jgi:hypothetical protein